MKYIKIYSEVDNDKVLEELMDLRKNHNLVHGGEHIEGYFHNLCGGFGVLLTEEEEQLIEPIFNED